MFSQTITTILFAGMILMVGTIGTVHATSPHSSFLDGTPSWLLLAERYNVDPDSFPGYGCHHGHRSFGCE